MRQVLRAAALAVLGIAVLPLFAADEKKPDEKKDVDKKGPEVVAAGSITGKIMSVDETKRALKVQISIPEINPDAARGIAQAQRDLQAAAYARTPQERLQKQQQAQQQLAQHQRTLYRTKNQDVDITTTDDVKVRKANPPDRFDEKGNPKKYTPEELKALKNDDPNPKLPGYNAEFGDIRQGQFVQITLVKKKGTPPRPEPGVKGKDVDKTVLNDALAEFAPHASLIVIAAEPPR